MYLFNGINGILAVSLTERGTCKVTMIFWLGAYISGSTSHKVSYFEQYIHVERCNWAALYDGTHCMRVTCWWLNMPAPGTVLGIGRHIRSMHPPLPHGSLQDMDLSLHVSQWISWPVVRHIYFLCIIPPSSTRCQSAIFWCEGKKYYRSILSKIHALKKCSQSSKYTYVDTYLLL